jgi:lipopolysaccharide export LptBFGC system permease protein LptF
MKNKILSSGKNIAIFFLSLALVVMSVIFYTGMTTQIIAQNERDSYKEYAEKADSVMKCLNTITVYHDSELNKNIVDAEEVQKCTSN